MLDNGLVFEYLLKNNQVNVNKLDEKFIFKVLYEKKMNIIKVENIPITSQSRFRMHLHDDATSKKKFIKDYGGEAEAVMTGRAIKLAKNMSEKESKNKCCNMTTIHIGITHNNYFMVT